MTSIGSNPEKERSSGIGKMGRGGETTSDKQQLEPFRRKKSKIKSILMEDAMAAACLWRNQCSSDKVTCGTNERR